MSEYLTLILTWVGGFLFGMGIAKELRRPRKPYWPIGRDADLPSNRRKK